MISSLIRRVSYVVQVVWIIPEELIKRVSQAQFSITLCLLSGFVNNRPESIHSLNRNIRDLYLPRLAAEQVLSMSARADRKFRAAH
jgi:hypothetical protein